MMKITTFLFLYMWIFVWKLLMVLIMLLFNFHMCFWRFKVVKVVSCIGKYCPRSFFLFHKKFLLFSQSQSCFKRLQSSDSSSIVYSEIGRRTHFKFYFLHGNINAGRIILITYVHVILQFRKHMYSTAWVHF